LNALYDMPLEMFLADPYPVYHRLRLEAPVCWDERSRVWVLTHYADVSAALRDPRFLTPKPAAANDPRSADFNRIISGMTLFKDPPEHTRLRALINKAFLPRFVDQLQPHIERVADQLLDQAQAAGRLELIGDLAFPLPITVISLLLGIPVEDHQHMQEWSHALAAALEPSDMLSGAVLEHGNQAALSFEDYFRTLIAAKRGHIQDDLISSLIAAEEQGNRLSTDELIAMCVLLLFAGHETTVNLIGNGTLSLLRHPEQLALLRGNADLIKTAVEEFLRYESSIQYTSRLLAEDVTMHGHTLRQRSEVYLVLGAANRDPQQFADPDRLDITRQDNKHLAFGAGIHYCVGAPLARVEGQIAINTLLRRFPRLKLANGTIEWRPLTGFRGLRSLALTF
jgi:cytochrome P450